MIAVIEPAHKVVWGFGSTEQLAMTHAQTEIAAKPHFKVGDLQYAHLSLDADLDCDGKVLWQWVITNEVVAPAAPLQQMGLF